MELRHLRAFVAVAEELHFGRAASRLRVAQPAVSQHVRQLERDVGVRLFERTTRQVRLTNAGAVFKEHAHRVLADADRALESALLAEQGARGEIRVGLTGVITWRLLPRMARAYRQRYPLVRLQLYPAVFSASHLDSLLAGSIDVCLIRAPVPATLASRVLLDEQLVAVLPEGHRLARRGSLELTDLAEEDFVSYPARQGSSLRDTAVQACSSVGFWPRIVQEAPDTHTVVALVGAGVGVALLPGSAEKLQLEGVVFRPVTGADMGAPIALAWRAGDPSPVLAGFLTVADEILPSPG